MQILECEMKIVFLFIFFEDGARFNLALMKLPNVSFFSRSLFRYMFD